MGTLAVLNFSPQLIENLTLAFPAHNLAVASTKLTMSKVMQRMWKIRDMGNFNAVFNVISKRLTFKS